LVVLVVCLLLAGLVYIVYIKKMRREMRSEVSETV